MLEGDVDAVEHVGEEGPEHVEVLAVLVLDDLEEGARREERGEAHVVGLGVQEPLLEDVADHGKVPAELVGAQEAGEVRKDGERTLSQEVIGRLCGPKKNNKIIIKLFIYIYLLEKERKEVCPEGRLAVALRVQLEHQGSDVRDGGVDPPPDGREGLVLEGPEQLSSRELSRGLGELHPEAEPVAGGGRQLGEGRPEDGDDHLAPGVGDGRRVAEGGEEAVDEDVGVVEAELLEGLLALVTLVVLGRKEGVQEEVELLDLLWCGGNSGDLCC